MNKVTSQAAPPVAANSTGGQAPARTESPVGHFSHSNAVCTHGAARTDGGVKSSSPVVCTDDDYPKFPAIIWVMLAAIIVAITTLIWVL